jgi:hypothetical protein
MALKRLSLTRGDSRTYTLTLKDGSAGTAFCLKNWVVYFTLKTNPALPDSAASLQKIVTTFSDTTSGTTGIAVIELLPADTKDLTPGEYDFDFSVLTAASKNYTILKGKFDLLYDVTASIGTAGTAA